MSLMPNTKEITPKISVREYTGNFHFSCKYFDLSKIWTGHCRQCSLYRKCDACNFEFRKFVSKNKFCKKCKDMTLDDLYLYIMWKLQDYMPLSMMECCNCGRTNVMILKNWCKSQDAVY